MWKTLLLTLCFIISLSAPVNDKMGKVPGYPATFNTSVYTGYLDLKHPDRAAHYVFVEGLGGANNKLPLTLWLNGGPGCSSLLGFLQEIGPYFLEDGKNYKEGDNLTFNPYSWHNVSNLLFLESPAGVGYSYNLDQKFIYTDGQTAQDNMQALLSFFDKFPEYKNSRFWLAGESYAGKYIPDLAVLIDKYNQIPNNQPIQFKGMLIGNGIMTFQYLQTSQTDYYIGRGFVDPETQSYYRSSCKTDPDSAGCSFFNIRFGEDVDEVNPYNVYGMCYYNDSFTGPKSSQEGILLSLKAKYSNRTNKARFNGAPCAYFDGIHNYFNIHEKEYKAAFPDMKWNGPCAENITYNIDPAGSIESYIYLLGRLFDVSYSIHLYNGNWDSVVPYHDTIAAFNLLTLSEAYLYTPWFTNNQHSGFQQLYSGLVFTIVKGASHQVPQSKRAEALQMFNNTLEGHKELYRKVRAQGIELPPFKVHLQGLAQQA